MDCWQFLLLFPVLPAICRGGLALDSSPSKLEEKCLQSMEKPGQLSVPGQLAQLY